MTASRLKSDAEQPVRSEPVFYPKEDDEPLGETEHQLIPLTYAHAALTTWFAGVPTTWVGADMFLYYEEGDPGKVVAPDVFVVTGTRKEPRREIFQVWVEGRVPDFVLEITSNHTRQNDLVTKFALYRQLGVQEYWLYDPTEETRVVPLLQGNRLVDGVYQPIPVTEMTAPNRYRGMSDLLGLELHAEPDWFRFFDSVAGEYLRSLQESEDALVAERRALAAERRARVAMERLLREHGIEPPAGYFTGNP